MASERFNRVGAVKIMLLECDKEKKITEQEYRHTLKYKNLKYDVYRCVCNGKRHYNRIIVGRFHQDRRVVKVHDSPGVFRGQSIFGQTLRKE